MLLRPPARHSAAATWSQLAGFGFQCGFAEKMYGAQDAKNLAVPCTHKAQWYFDQYVANGGKSPAAYEPYDHPPLFYEVKARHEGRALARINWLEALSPS